MPNKQPEHLAQETITATGKQAARWIADHGRRYVSRTLLAVLSTGAAGVALAFFTLPVLAIALPGLALVCLGGYTVFSHKLLHEERVMRQWAFVSGKRTQQDVLKRDIMVDKAILAIMGKPQDRVLRLQARPRELAQALRVVQHRLVETRAAERPQPSGTGSRRSAPPKEPDLDVVRTRIASRETEVAKLEAEIQSLATPEDVGLQMAAEDAQQAAASTRDAALQASQAARDRRRRGLPGTQRGTNMAVELAVRPNGQRDVRKLSPTATPELIARGDLGPRADDGPT